MRTIHLLVAALSAAVIAGGCTTAPLEMSKAEAPAPERIQAADLAHSGGAIPHGHGLLAIAQDALLWKGGCTYDMHFNDRPVVRLLPGEGLRFALPAGEVRVRMETGSFLCDRFSTQITVRVVAGKTLHVRSGFLDHRPFLRTLDYE